MPRRQFVVSPGQTRQTLAEAIKLQLHFPWPEARRLVCSGQVILDGAVCTDEYRRVHPGQRVTVTGPGGPRPAKPRPTPPAAADAPPPVLTYVDAHLVVVDKPAGLTTMRHRHEAAEFGDRGKRFLPPTLADLLPDLLAGQGAGRRAPVRAVHRLDRDTTGLVVFARSVPAERHLGRQFRAHTVERTYLALVRGRAKSERIESYLVEDRGDGRRGSTTKAGQGQRAVTHVRVLEDLGEFTLVECRLETGRTHQVRIHLGERGTPLCGERVYDRPLHGPPAADGSGATRPALHAATLGLEHPATGERVRWSAPLPADMKGWLKALRQRRQCQRGDKGAREEEG